MALEERFLEKVDPQDGCWIWTAARKASGYGSYWDGSKMETAHRYAYVQTYGPIGRGSVIRHTCDNPSCVNPSHLKVGTQLDNMRDRQERQRVARGEWHHKAKLSDEQVAEIVALKGQESCTQTAQRYGISQGYVSKLQNPQTYRKRQPIAQRVLDRDTAERVREAFKEGGTIADLARRFSCSYDAVRTAIQNEERYK